MEKIKAMIEEYKQLRGLIKGMNKYFTKAEIFEMMKYCNKSMFGEAE